MITITKQEHVAGKSCGFSLVELLIAIGIVAILASLAAPAFTTYIKDTRASNAALQLSSDLNLARSEAIKRNAGVLVCAITATEACTAGTDWVGGWKLCYDADSDGNCDDSTVAKPNPIKVRRALSGGLTITGPATSFWFTPTSALASAGGGTKAFSINAGKWQVSVATTGHIATTH